MADTVLYRIQSGVVQLIEEAVSSWKEGGRDGELLHELQGLVGLCLTMPDRLKEVWDLSCRRSGFWPASEHQENGEHLRALFDRAVIAIESLRDLARQFEQQGHPIRRSEELEQALERLKDLRQRFVDSWLWITPEIMQESREEYARGDCQTVQEILDELQSKNPQLYSAARRRLESS